MGGSLVIPGQPGTVVPTRFSVTLRDAAYRNEFGFFIADDASGRIGMFLPGMPGYAAAALAPGRRLQLFTGAAQAGAVVTVPLSAGLPVGYYLIQNGSAEEWQATNPGNGLGGRPLAFFSYPAANPDGFGHMRELPGNQVAVEDLTGGGDQDFNDIVVKADFLAPPARPLTVTPIGGGGPTSNPAFSGTVPGGRSAAKRLTGSIDGKPPVDIIRFVQPDGHFTIDKPLLVAINHGPLSEGKHTLHLVETRPDGTTSTSDVTFTFVKTNFEDGLAAWTVGERGGSATKRGTVSFQNDQATLREGDSFETTLSRSFTVPGNSPALAFTFSTPAFDTKSAGFVKDAFEAALLDDAGNPLVGTIAGGRDSFFNITEGQKTAAGLGTTVSGGTVTVSLAGVPAGARATLVFRLVNNDSDTGSSATLQSVRLPSGTVALAAQKFFVADAAAGTTFRYGVEGLAAGTFKLPAGAATPRGVASNPAGDTVWVIDSTTRKVGVYSADGTVKGSWQAADVTDPQGVTVNNGDLWLVDRGDKRVRRYAGGAVLTSGVATATSSFLLNAANGSPSDLVTDGSTVWVTDDAKASVFVYGVDGSLLGNWKLDGDNAAPSGITRNPKGGKDLWVVDRAKKEVFQYASAADVRAGAQGAAGTFLLTPADNDPEGIADPPVTDPNDPRDWQGATVGTFAALIYGTDTAENRQKVIDAKLLDDGIFDPTRYHAATLLATPWALGTSDNPSRGGGTIGQSLDSTGTGSYDYGGGGSIFDAANAIDDRWFQTSDTVGDTVFDLGAPSTKAAVFETIDHGPLPGEAIESTVYLSNDLVHWTQATFERLWLEGFKPNAGIKWDGFTFAVGTPDDQPFRYASIIWGGPGALRSDGDNEINGVMGLKNDFTPALSPPTIVISSPADGSQVVAGSTVLISGQATADQPAFADGSRVENRITEVTVNGQPVDVLDAGGAFYTQVVLPAGVSTYQFTAVDAFGLSATTTLTLDAGQRDPAKVDVSQFSDLTASFAPLYARTSFHEDDRNLYADVTVQNRGKYPASVPLLVGVKNISDPSVTPTNTAGVTPDGVPYYDFTSLPTGSKQLSPNAKTGTLSLAFHNPNRVHFTYDLVFLGILNRPPAITSVPNTEALVGRVYQYAVTATDPDGDPLTFKLVTAPSGMTIGKTGRISWAPTSGQAGNQEVLIRVEDGRGGSAEQRYTLSVTQPPPNRPPVFTSTAVVDASVGKPYHYQATATDPDGDALTFSLAASPPAGMAINATTGAVTWTPTSAQRGDKPVTIEVTDGRGGSASQTFTVCVEDVRNHAPVIVSQPIVLTKPNTTNLVQNGSFEDYAIPPSSWSVPGIVDLALPVGDSDIAGWTIIKGNIDYVGPFHDTPSGGWVASNGERSLDLDGNPGTGGVSQVIPTIPGSQYRVAFDISGNPDSNDLFPEPLTKKSLRVTAAGQSADFSYDTATKGNSFGDMKWETEAFVFTAHSSATTLEFFSTTPAMFTGPTLDNVSVRPVSAGAAYSYAVTAVDPDGDPVTFALTQGPEGMTIDSSTGLITWNAPDSEAGRDVAVAVRVDDGRGGFDEQSFTLRVTAQGGASSPPKVFDPVIKWKKDTFTVLPEFDQVMMTPAAIDLNGDHVPDIVFSAFDRNNYGSSSAPGVLRAISGDDGHELWTVTDPGLRVDAYAGIAVGDIDGDGKPEIIAEHESGRLIAFNSDGMFRWLSPEIPGGVVWGSASLADLDHDGNSEVIIGSTVLNTDGTIRWTGSTVGGTGIGSNVAGPLSIVADLDLDGSQEIVAGNSAYHSDGSLYWNAGIPDGFDAVGNFDGGPYPEIVSVAAGAVYMLDHTGKVLWGPSPIPGGGLGGAPTIADMDGDGKLDIGVAGANDYVVFNGDGSVKWQSPTQDGSSNVTGSSVFDFLGDGKAETVYGDEVYLRVYDGADGRVLYQLPKGSGTTYEYPLIVDVDGDGHADIVAVANDYAFGDKTGIYVISNRNNDWVPTRSIWNQHTYHITNINDDGSIPRHEDNSWQLYNTYRLNVLTQDSDTQGEADLVPTSVTWTGPGTTPTFTVHVENQGVTVVKPGVQVAFYDGDPSKEGHLLGTAVTTTSLQIHHPADVSISAPGAVNDLWVRVNDDGMGNSAVKESDKENNTFRAGIDTDPTNYAPVFHPKLSSPRATVAARSRYRYDPVVTDPDAADFVSFDLVDAPEGMAVHPRLGTVVWTPALDQIGTHTVVLRARDDHGNVALQSFDITVLAPNTAPVITSTPAGTPPVVGLPFVYQVRAQDAEQDALGYSLDTPVGDMRIDAKGLLRWTPTEDLLGSQSVTVVVRDGKGGEASQTLNFTVLASATDAAPRIVTPLPRQTTWLGHIYARTIDAVDPDGDPLSFTLDDGPAGMTVDDTGLMRWTPPGLTAAPIPVKVTVSDGRGGTASVDFTLSVVSQEVNEAPTITSTPPSGVIDVGRPLAYDLAARDADGDAVTWSFVSGPIGVSLNGTTGTLRWTPAEDQEGSVSVTVRATDSLGASSTQTFTLVVSCEDQPPVIVSKPPTVAYANFPYVYPVQATDPEGDKLSFSLDNTPAGVHIDETTGLITWTPTADEKGPQQVVIRVTDSAGNTATQAFAVVVSTETPNRPPVITSQPNVLAMPGKPYAYDVKASDPDGDALTYKLLQGPGGMKIDATGRLTWTPAAAGQQTVTVQVLDGRGGQAVQTYTLTVQANKPPVISSQPVLTVTTGAPYRYDVRATDPEGGPLIYAVGGPAGMTIDAVGRITWASTGSPRKEHVKVTVTDNQGLTATQEFDLQVLPDTKAPTLRVVLPSSPVRIGTTVAVVVSATDDVGVKTVTLSEDGSQLALSASGQAVVTLDTPGRHTFTATATDPSGNTGTASAELVAYDPDHADAPTVSITKLVEMLPKSGTKEFDPSATAMPSLSYLTDVFGTIQASSHLLSSWKLLVAREDRVDMDALDPSDPHWQTIATGTNEVVGGKLGTFDPTMLLADGYVIAVVAYDALGHQTVKAVEVTVAANVQLGEFTLDFTDLAIPLNGIPIEVTRHYDTRQAGDQADFGFGWSLVVRDARIREVGTVASQGAFDGGGPAFFPGRTKVYLTSPSGRREGFTFNVTNLRGTLFGGVGDPVFTPDPGVTDQLFADGVYTTGGILGALGSYNPDDYRLTTPDGLTYSYSQFSGLQKISDLNGNILTFTTDGIQHASGGKITTSIKFTRDGQGRITEIQVPVAEGSADMRPAVRYHYDANGDLVNVEEVTRAAPPAQVLTTTFTYLTTGGRKHYLDQYFDERVKRAVKTEYDPATGRVTSVQDALGKESKQDYSEIGNFTEKVRDKNGNWTAITYNERGNVVEQVDGAGDVTRYQYNHPDDPWNIDKESRVTHVVNGRDVNVDYTYDGRGNVLTQTDASGTTIYKYNEFNKVTLVQGPINPPTVYDYDARGNLTKIVNAKGDSSIFTYDDQGHVTTFTDFAGNTTSFSDFCPCGKPGKITNPDPKHTYRTIEDNLYGEITKQTDELGNVVVKNTYDDLGRLLTTVDGELRETDYTYDGMNQKTVTKVRHDGLPNELTQYEYDDNGKRTRITDAENGVTNFTYHDDGSQKTITDPDGNTTTFFLDGANRVRQEIDPLENSTFYDYDAVGNQTKITDRNGQVRTFTYDDLNHLKTEDWLDGQGNVIRTISYDYDAAGNLLLAQDPDSILTYTYDELNQVRTATTAYPSFPGFQPLTLSYTYDKNGNVTTVTDNTGVQVASHYSSRDELDVRTWQGSGIDPVQLVFSYRDDGLLKDLDRYASLNKSVPAGKTTYTYWKNGLAKNITHLDQNGSVIAQYDYLYNDVNLVKQEMYQSPKSSFSNVARYTYDRTEQLTDVVNSNPQQPNETFRYDKNGNRKTSTLGSEVSTYTYPDGGKPADNQVLGDGKFTYTYDKDGNLRTKTEIATSNVTIYTYDYKGRLVGVEEMSKGGIVLRTMTYRYDVKDRRIAEVVDTDGQGPSAPVATVFSYDGDNSWADFEETGRVATRYLVGANLDTMLARFRPSEGTVFYYVDKLGTLRDAKSPISDRFASVRFSSFGAVLSSVGSVVTGRFLFTGRELGTVFGDYYYRARYYDPLVGRFFSEDPLHDRDGKVNSRAYVENSPTNRTDPTGEVSIGQYLLVSGNRGVQAGFLGGIAELVHTGNVKSAATAFVVGFLLGFVGGAILLRFGYTPLPNDPANLVVNGAVGLLAKVVAKEFLAFLPHPEQLALEVAKALIHRVTGK